jgi:hypothetical protein
MDPYTWTEFFTQAVLPIPAEEAMKEVWRNGFGLSEEQVKAYWDALTTISYMALTGGRMSEDLEVSQ